MIDFGISFTLMSSNSKTIPNRVFIGCPWKTIRPKYLKTVGRLEKTYPLHFILIGRETDQRAEELLGLIKKNLRSSTMAIFDVTTGNANVSLEYGLSDAWDMEKVLYLNVHKSSKKSSQDNPIIADLAGQKRRQYKNEDGLKKLLNEFSEEHDFTKRFEISLKKVVRNVKTRHTKKKYRNLSIKAIRYFDDKENARRTSLVEYLLGEGYEEREIEFVLKGLNKHGVLSIASGGHAMAKIK